MTAHYFPESDHPDLQPFVQAFVSMMFSHAAFERRIADMLETITASTVSVRPQTLVGGLRIAGPETSGS